MRKFGIGLWFLLFCVRPSPAQDSGMSGRVLAAMAKATRFMMDSVAVQGGFVWYYLPDLSRRWGEMEAYPTMAWVQDGGTVSVGEALLEAWEATGDAYYRAAALRTAGALMQGQSRHGGWNYMMDFGGESSTRKWYATVGRNGWRLEEFRHYLGNDTFDDDVTTGAARFLLRMYLVSRDTAIRSAVDRALSFVLRSQYPVGGWPQRYPSTHDPQRPGPAGYSAYHTFNDDVIWENIRFLLLCRDALGDTSLNRAIRRGMDFHLLTQQSNGAWGQQYDMDLRVAAARSYEPAALLPRTTFANARQLLRFYRITGDRRYLEAVPRAIEWLEATRLPAERSDGGRFTHPLFVDAASGRPVYVHRRGSNAVHGRYYADTSDRRLLSHMSGKVRLDVEGLKRAYADHLRLRAGGPAPPQLPSEGPEVTVRQVDSVLALLDARGRWLEPHAMVSHPYRGDGVLSEPTDAYASTHVGDSTDTSPFRDTTGRLYLSTPAFVRNMRLLARYLQQGRPVAAEVWRLRAADRIGRHGALVTGAPRRAVEGGDSCLCFDGVDDGLRVASIPVAGWPVFTIEVRFKPDAKGPRAPRILHVEDEEGNRGTIEARLTDDGGWYLDVFLKDGRTGAGVTLVDSTRVHRADGWHTVALVYDGQWISSHVDGRPELSAPLRMGPFGRGNTSVGMRLNRAYPFRGGVAEVGFYPGDRYRW